MFGSQENEDCNFLENTDDWNTDIKLSKEFETMGFYISDHPLNQYKAIFKQFNITTFEEFEKNTDILSSNIACTVLKVQEKKTQKGNSYAIVKFSDLSNTFELFIFSDIFEGKRDILKEGKSLMLTLIKNYSDESKTQKRINVKKIIMLKHEINKPIENITFRFNNFEELKQLNKLTKIEGKTTVNIFINQQDKTFKFALKAKRKVNYKLINMYKLEENVVFE